MKTGVYGGTFNPIHRAHIHILGEFVRRLSLQRVLLVPASVPPHKQVPDLALASDRFAMCRLAAKEIPGAEVEVSDMELRRAGKSYTADTLDELAKKWPGDELYLLMGEDMFLTVDKWYRPEVIAARAVLCGSPRSTHGLEKLLQKKQMLEEKLHAHCVVENIPYLPASSTEIRARVAAGEDISHLVPEGVEAYIRQHGIYLPAGG